jgi:enoyl-CoA hydratase
MEYDYIIVEKEVRPFVSLIRLNRPKELNALNLALINELVHAFGELDASDATRCIVITGNDRAFAAGADIKEMAGRSAIDMHKIDQFSKWDAVRRCKTPVIAAVSGFALGGGCELTMLCDMIVASETAKFGQPEIKIGVMPGAGGTQRLTRAVGKALAMEMVLTGRFISAEEAFHAGLINKVSPPELYLDEALDLAQNVASMSPLAAQLAKEAVLKAFDTPLADGLLFERKNFYMLFSTEDQKEGMQAFVEKRKPDWKGR